MKVVLANGKEFELSSQPVSRNKYIQNVARDTIEFHFDRSKYSADEIFNLLSEDKNIEKFKLVETSIVDGGEIKRNEYLYNNYCIVNEMCLKDVVIEKETPESEEVKEQVISVTLAQLTYSEFQQRKTQSKINELTEQNLMLMEAVAEIYESQIVGGAE